ncbi:hypothetical protein J3E69DRAFT_322600 [Trichoderma sp. SZMC 28015]
MLQVMYFAKSASLLGAPFCHSAAALGLGGMSMGGEMERKKKGPGHNSNLTQSGNRYARRAVGLQMGLYCTVLYCARMLLQDNNI